MDYGTPYNFSHFYSSNSSHDSSSFDYQSYEPRRVHNSWHQSHVPQPPVETMNRSQAWNQMVDRKVSDEAFEEDDVHRQALLRKMLKKLEDIQAGLSTMADRIDKFNQKWSKFPTTIGENVEVIHEDCGKLVDSGEEFAEDVRKNGEHQVFDKITELGFDTHTEDFVIEQAIDDEELLMGAIVGGRVCAKEVLDLEEHRVLEKMSEPNSELFDKEIGMRESRESNSEVPPPLPVPPPLLCRILPPGDLVSLIIGSLSGTPGYRMNEVEGGRCFSKAIATVKRRGYTEPDPQDGLSGIDVAKNGLSSTPRVNYKIIGDIIGYKCGSLELSSHNQNEKEVVKKVVFKCERISTELEWELYAISWAHYDQYSEVELGSSEARIVTQHDVNEVCEAGDSDSSLILTLYKLVGVNFLMFLYRKHLEGALVIDDGKNEMYQFKRDVQTNAAYLIKGDSMVYGSRSPIWREGFNSSGDAGNVETGLHTLTSFLKKLLVVGKHYADIIEDSFGSHSYCIRKMTSLTSVDKSHFHRILLHYPLRVNRFTWFRLRVEFLLDGELKIATADNDVKAFIQVFEATKEANLFVMRLHDKWYSRKPKMKRKREGLLKAFTVASESNGLRDTNGRSFGRRVVILDTVARYRSIVVILDLEYDDLISEMFNTFLVVARDGNIENVMTSMQIIKEKSYWLQHFLEKSYKIGGEDHGLSLSNAYVIDMAFINILSIMQSHTFSRDYYEAATLTLCAALQVSLNPDELGSFIVRDNFHQIDIQDCQIDLNEVVNVNIELVVGLLKDPATKSEFTLPNIQTIGALRHVVGCLFNPRLGVADDDSYPRKKDEIANECPGDEDVSWKVRRAAAKYLTALIVSQPEMLSMLCEEARLKLISRFREREENFRLDIFYTFFRQPRQTGNVMKGNVASSSGGFGCDLVIIGVGVGNYGVVLHAVKKGLKTAIIKADQEGGTCVAAAGYDRQEVVDSANNLVLKIKSKLTSPMKALGVDILTGSGTILGPQKLKYGKEDNFIIAKDIMTAANLIAMVPKAIEIDGKMVITNDHAIVCFRGAGPHNSCTIAISLGTKEVHHRLCGILSACGIGMAGVVKISGKRFKKFTVELMLIATRQHTHCVRRLGDCILGDERMCQTALNNEVIYLPGLRPPPEPPPLIKH